MNYNIQGLSIYAEVDGTAEPALVFLHYWGGTSRTWRRVTAELEGRFKTVAYDARGWGKSDKTRAGYKLADLADETLSLVKALGIKQYVIVPRHSRRMDRSCLDRVTHQERPSIDPQIVGISGVIIPAEGGLPDQVL
jgi:hypothetical protein